MVLASLHPLCRNGPKSLGKVDLFPSCVQDFAGSGGGKDDEFQRERRHGFPLAQIGHESGI